MVIGDGPTNRIFGIGELRKIHRLLRASSCEKSLCEHSPQCGLRPLFASGRGAYTNRKVRSHLGLSLLPYGSAIRSLLSPFGHGHEHHQDDQAAAIVAFGCIVGSSWAQYDWRARPEPTKVKTADASGDHRATPMKPAPPPLTLRQIPKQDVVLAGCGCMQAQWTKDEKIPLPWRGPYLCPAVGCNRVVMPPETVRTPNINPAKPPR
jgi:hypothetical protein